MWPTRIKVNLKPRLRNIFFLFLCFRRIIVYGRATKEVIKPRRVLICQLAKLGDMICTTPMFRAVKSQYPDCHLYVLGNEKNRDLVAYNPDVDEYISYNGDFFDTVKKLRSKNIDFGCITGPGLKQLALLFLANIPCIAAPAVKNGFSPYETRTYRLLRNFVISVPYRMGYYGPLEYLRLLEPGGIVSHDTKKHLFFSDTASQSLKAFFQDRNISFQKDFVVCVAPSVGNKVRLWEAEKFVEVIRHVLRTYNAKVILLGGKGDIEQINKVYERLLAYRLDDRIVRCTQFNIDQLKALISKVNIFVSVETGPTFIAEAFDIPLINIVGPVDDREQSPQGPFFKVVKVNRRVPVIHTMNARHYDLKEARRQIEAISVEQVVMAMRELMDQLGATTLA